MAVRRLRCKQCRLFVDRDEMVQTNFGNFCSSDCVEEQMGEKRAKKRAAARQVKRRTRPSRRIPPEVRKAVYARDEVCRWCGDPGQECHHVIYRRHGGPDVEGNLILLCRECHERAHSSKQAYQPLLLRYLELVVQDVRLTIPEIVSELRAADELSELQLERLAA